MDPEAVPNENCVGCVHFECCDLYKEIQRALDTIAFERRKAGHKDAEAKLPVASQIAAICPQFLPARES